MPTPVTIPLPLPLVATTEQVHHRITSVVVDGFSQWWQMPLLVAAFAALAAFAIWMVRRDAAELPRGVAVLLAALRLGALAALAAAYLDFERTAEHEVLFPSRVAVLVDTSASMTIDDGRAAADGADASRAARALGALEAGGLLAALGDTHEVSLWRFDADAEPLGVLSARPGAAAVGRESAAAAEQATEGTLPPWRERLVPRGFETRLGETLAHVIDQEPPGVLAGVIVLSDGANNAGLDPAAAAAALVRSRVPVHTVGIGSDTLPPNVRVADLLAPARVFPGDRFSVTGYVQAQGLAGRTVRVELAEAAAGGTGRVIEAADVVLAADGALATARFDVPGLDTTGRRELVMRIAAPAEDRAAADDSQAVEVEVVDRVTQVLLMAGGPSREYQFMRNVLERDKSFAVDVLLGTAAPGISQDARRILDAFPPTAEALAEYEAAIALAGNEKASQPQKRSAEVGKARCLLLQGRHDAAAETVLQIINAANPEEKELLSRAYTVLGATYRAMGGKEQDALIQFLMVELVYNTLPETHAEALFNLAELWDNGGNPERAREARQNLKSAYPDSPWAAKLNPSKS
jgi:tetratricopeptide (TPR) repeat protein